jgi:hypothetical protein
LLFEWSVVTGIDGHLLPEWPVTCSEIRNVEAKCLLCHGDNVSKDIGDKIQNLYPQDKATGFKLGEFRGFIWIKEK